MPAIGNNKSRVREWINELLDDNNKHCIHCRCCGKMRIIININIIIRRWFLADRTNGRAIGTVLRLSLSVTWSIDCG